MRNSPGHLPQGGQQLVLARILLEIPNGSGGDGSDDGVLLVGAFPTTLVELACCGMRVHRYLAAPQFVLIQKSQPGRWGNARPSFQ